MKIPALSLLLKVKQFGAKYSVFLLFLALAVVYTYLVLKIGTLSNPAVGDNDVAKQIKTAPTLRIDPAIVKTFQSLEDNSPAVQTLFEESRTNPFHE